MILPQRTHIALQAAVGTHRRMLRHCIIPAGCAAVGGAFPGRCGMLSSQDSHTGLSGPAASAQLLQTRGSTSRLQ